MYISRLPLESERSREKHVGVKVLSKCARADSYTRTRTHTHAHTHTHTRTRTHTYRRIHTADVETYLFVFWIFAASAALATPMMVISDWFS